MHYVISDVHNDAGRLNRILQTIKFDKNTDRLFILGDLFDRSGYAPQPLGVYNTVQSLQDSCTVLRGNHDEWLADYILKYLDTPDKKRPKLPPYGYNTFGLIQDRLTEVDLKELASWIKSLPLQIEVVINDVEYLFAHAQTANPSEIREDDHYLMGDVDFSFLKKGIPGYISVCGHHLTDSIRLWYGEEHRPKKQEIWCNPKKNVFEIDCGCGFSNGRLGCLRLEDKKTFYE